MSESKIKCTLISDLHGFKPKNFTAGDLLIIAGDLTATHTEREFEQFLGWMVYQDYEKIVVIGGNHDTYLQETPDFLYDKTHKFQYLCDSGINFKGLKIWGTPWCKTFSGMSSRCKAFCVDGERELQEKWDLIPDDTDILVTHTPPSGIGDLIYRNKSANHVGSQSLMKRIEKIKPKISVFGHIHEGYGTYRVPDIDTKFYNASIMDEFYEPVNKPIHIQI